MNYFNTDTEILELDGLNTKAEDGDDELDTVPDALGSSLFDFKAICTSEHCSPNDRGVQKNVDRSEDSCPDCKYFLFWSRELA